MTERMKQRKEKRKREKTLRIYLGEGELVKMRGRAPTERRGDVS